MTATKLISLYCLGGAGLAFWLLIRFPGFGPKSILRAAVAVLAAFIVAAFVPLLLEASIAAGELTGGLVALFGLVLPTLTAIFWSAACLLRAFCGLLTGMR